MRIVALNDEVLAAVEELMAQGEPYVRARTSSDYWLYQTLFSTTCPVALDDGNVVGVVIAMRSQDDPDDVYVQDVMVHRRHRRRGIASALLRQVIDQAARWKCRRIYLTSEPQNSAAAATWQRLGFRNIAGDKELNGVQVISGYKGPGKDRAVFQLDLG
jgi:ribosomal protein S18 acetylase RimI-like enzyme